MSNRFIEINLADIPPADILEVLSFETIRQQIIDDLTARLNAEGIPYDTGMLESEPFVMLSETYAARELNWRARVNDTVKAIMLASAWGGNLDHVGQILETQRQIVNGVAEEDDSYRARIQLAPEAFSVAGPEGAYVYAARRVLGPEGAIDATAIMTTPGTVLNTILMGNGVYAPTQDQINRLALAFRADDAIPLTDVVSISGPKIISTDIIATATLYPGPDADIVRAQINSAVTALEATQTKLGHSVTIDAITSAIRRPGVFSVHLQNPVSDVILNPTQVIKFGTVSVNIPRQRMT